jgi:acetyl-CoA C-acetyltransferase
MKDAYIFGGVRSPFGRHGGALSPVRTDDLAAGVLRQLLERYPVDRNAIEDVIAGCTNQAGEDSRNVARNAALLAGLPVTIPGITVNRLCASGLAAVIQAGHSVAANHGELFVAGGVEGMSRAPFVVAKAESAYSRSFTSYDTTMGERFPNPEIHKNFGAHSMPQTGDNVARDFKVSREQADEFALGSQQKYARALATGFYDDELVPVTIKPARPKDDPVTVSKDEHPRSDSSLAALAKLKPLFPDGVVTAGNASGINDGAAFLIIGSHDAGKKYNLRPLARIISSAASGVEPRIMGIGPVTAIQKALQRANLTLKDLDLIEINEAFASQVLACTNLLEIAGNDPRLNPNGGAIAIGHPLGASGARLALTAARQLQKSQGRYGVVSLCVGLGQGLAMVIERTA